MMHKYTVEWRLGFVHSWNCTVLSFLPPLSVCMWVCVCLCVTLSIFDGARRL
ncbi:hypothetical protein Lalb_Chr03g0035351 [Lupinus albus]|uniref:Uncharacterized protein n=1 Tax=Lupinus albus TaxID=3870 RepID=A0A6A4QX08_LUPAL|nr:hypothetical protein Lalb_Chr03g0035351 [Lupinus albus]